MKHLRYYKSSAKSYFWRTKQQQEIDYVEITNNHVKAYGFKWIKDKGRTPKAFVDNYNSDITVINKKNFRSFVQP